MRNPHPGGHCQGLEGRQRSGSPWAWGRLLELCTNLMNREQGLLLRRAECDHHCYWDGAGLGSSSSTPGCAQVGLDGLSFWWQVSTAPLSRALQSDSQSWKLFSLYERAIRLMCSICPQHTVITTCLCHHLLWKRRAATWKLLLVLSARGEKKNIHWFSAGLMISYEKPIGSWEVPPGVSLLHLTPIPTDLTVSASVCCWRRRRMQLSW